MLATADDEGRFSLTGTLPQDSDGQIAVSVMGVSGLTASQTLKVEQVSAEDFTALELTPAGTLAMTQGDTLALTVLGVKADGSKVSLSPDTLTFTTTGSVTVDADGTLTVTGTGAGTVTAKLGTLQSNTLQIQAQAGGGDSGTDSGTDGGTTPPPSGTDSGTTTPPTGDSASLLLWLIALLTSVLGTLCIFIWRKRHLGEMQQAGEGSAKANGGSATVRPRFAYRKQSK
jgi:hypothetical protein